MASITLATVWLSVASDYSDYITLTTMSALTSAPQNPGSVRRYAGGRFRAVTQAGTPNQFAVNAHACDRTTIEWFESHTGIVVLVRDDRGRKFYGTYFVPSTTEHAYDVEGDITVTISEVSFSEAV